LRCQLALFDARVSASPDARRQQQDDRSNMRPRERAAQAYQAKLEDIRTQVSSGALVIRQMTKAEQKKWAKQRIALEATWSPQQRARQETALKRRRQRAKHNAEITAEIAAE
jgi:hypothetical protein